MRPAEKESQESCLARLPHGVGGGPPTWLPLLHRLHCVLRPHLSPSLVLSCLGRKQVETRSCQAPLAQPWGP